MILDMIRYRTSNNVIIAPHFGHVFLCLFYFWVGFPLVRKYAPQALKAQESQASFSPSRNTQYKKQKNVVSNNANIHTHTHTHTPHTKCNKPEPSVFGLHLPGLGHACYQSYGGNVQQNYISKDVCWDNYSRKIKIILINEERINVGKQINRYPEDFTTPRSLLYLHYSLLKV